MTIKIVEILNRFLIYFFFAHISDSNSMETSLNFNENSHLSERKGRKSGITKFAWGKLVKKSLTVK